MAALRGLPARLYQQILFGLIGILMPVFAHSAPYAAYVMDARTGQVLYSQNADTRLHPASLTKMVTLYIVFDAIRRGEISLDTMVTVSKNAASKPPSRLGLKAGQKIALRYLIRAAAVKSANDAASAMGDFLAGSEPAFAERMNRTARALGMKNSTFKTANGLTAAGHLSTAHDMSIVGRRLFYDFPQYYNIFSRRSADAGMAQVNNTNRKFLDAYKGADGIKTGYTGPAGFNLTASAERGNVRIIATVFGGTSTAQRNAKMTELLDIGFRNAPGNAKTVRTGPVEMPADVDMVVASVVASQAGAQVADEGASRGAGKTIRLITSLASSPRPRARPDSSAPAGAVPEAAVTVAVDAMQDSIDGALALAAGPEPVPFQVVTETATTEPVAEPATVTAVPRPMPAPVSEQVPDMAVAAVTALPTAADPDRPIDLAVLVPSPVIEPTDPAETMIVALSAPIKPTHPKPRKAERKAIVPAAPEIVTRMSTSGGRHWGVTLGHYAARATAERMLMKTMLSESSTLGEGLRKVAPHRGGGYDANFVGLTQEQADMACARLLARALDCSPIGP